MKLLMDKAGAIASSSHSRSKQHFCQTKMAAISAFPSSILIRRSNFHGVSIRSLSSLQSIRLLRLGSIRTKKSPEIRRIRAVADDTLISEEEKEVQVDQTVSVQVSPSDMLTMFFKAEGTMNDSAVSVATKALEETEGVSDLKVQILVGIASVELTKQTTVQATGVASNLVEIIQGAGFKLQTLNLSFEDEEDLVG